MAAALIPVAASVAGSVVSNIMNQGKGGGGPQAANVINPVEAGQTGKAYTGVQNSMEAQNQLLQALQGQQGLQNQSNVFNQLKNVASGAGPNPAQTMLNEATGANVANQAALMAGQRGTGANAGMIARQAAQQGANIQQQAAGQGAVMQANQQLAALNQLGGMANQMAGQQIGQTNQNVVAQQGEQNALFGAVQGVNQANVSNQASINQANAALGAGSQQQMGSIIGGGLQGMGAALAPRESKAPTPKQAAQGGMIHAYADGGGVMPQPPIPTQQPQMAAPIDTSPKSSFTKFLLSRSGNAPISAQAQPTMAFAQGGQVPALVSPGEKYLPPQAVEQVKQGVNPMQVGETIPGKPKVKGAKNSYANDTVPKTLEEGGIVLPRSVTQSKHPQWAAHKFVSAILAKQGKGLK